jgi:hypothetical protein
MIADSQPDNALGGAEGRSAAADSGEQGEFDPGLDADGQPTGRLLITS